MSRCKPVPDGFNTVSAYLVVDDAAEALQFYAEAFGAEPGLRMSGPDGKGTLHAEMRIGGSTVMLSDANPIWGTRSPKLLGGSPATLHVYVEDADALFERATKAGCEVKFPISDTFWGDRYAKVSDPYGFEWGIATHIEDLSAEELERRKQEFFSHLGVEHCPGNE
jgi:uncharacterized glyoxalase superfamily protein PhnB